MNRVEHRGEPVIERLRGRHRDRSGADPVGDWMARCATDREFCRWLTLVLDVDLTDEERRVCAASATSSTPDAFVMVTRDEYDTWHQPTSDVSTAPHVRPWSAT